MRLLQQPPLVDLSGEYAKGAKVQFRTSVHRFSCNAAPSGTSFATNPIFGTRTWIDGKRVGELSYGMPFFRFRRGTRPCVRFVNKTNFVWNLHWHGLNTTMPVDGAFGAVEFGEDTKIGPELRLHFPCIQNNSALLWVHSHAMFIELSHIYAGVVGLLDIVDSFSESLPFEYGDNRVLLVYQDLDLDSTGALTNASIWQTSRSCFGSINGQSCINWYSSKRHKFVQKLRHRSSLNLFRFDFLNASSYFRTMYLGVCDRHRRIKSFYLILSDVGLRGPAPLRMIEVAVGARVGLLIDLKDFEDEEAWLFAYNFDLTEVSFVAWNGQALQGQVPVGPNPTPSPVPIPGPDTNLTYPLVASIPSREEILPNGNRAPPKRFTIKPFLRVCRRRSGNKNVDLRSVLDRIRRIVFGEKNVALYKSVLEGDNWELTSPLNYLALLNPKYYFALPAHTAPVRNQALFFETLLNYNVVGGNPLGATECVFDANRAMTDMWNSAELDLEFAISQYNLAPNNFQPSALPDCLFKIETGQNDTMTVQLFASAVSYGDTTTVPLATATIVFPERLKPFNLAQWIQLVNSTFQVTTINGGPLSNVLTVDWSFFPFVLQRLDNTTTFLKTILIKTLNRSSLYVRFVGPWPLLQFFGKAFGAMSAQSGGMSGDANNGLPQALATYATTDPLVAITITQNAELIIPPASTFLGFVDGFQSDQFFDFSVQLDSTEHLVYHNGDTNPSHPYHIHHNGGFVVVTDPQNSPGLVKRSYAAMLYSRDTYGIGPQQSVGFYFKYPNYSSEDTQGIRPKIPFLGLMFHCHYLPHVSMNMMGAFYVYRHREDYFS